MTATPAIRLFRGPYITPWLDQVAQLRLTVFRDWPYLYEGDLDYERDYLAAYVRSADSLFVMAFDGDQVVGAVEGRVAHPRGHPAVPEDHAPDDGQPDQEEREEAVHRRDGVNTFALAFDFRVHETGNNNSCHAEHGLFCLPFR